MIHILVVEDDERLNHIVCTYLRDSGFEAKGCLNAEDAYEEMYGQLYELIISDIMMPGIDGFEFARTVRKVNQRIPILFMSARDDLPSKQKGFQLGIDDYMVKPVDLDEMVLRVRALLRRANIEMERRITAGNLTLDADGMSTGAEGPTGPTGPTGPAGSVTPAAAVNDATGTGDIVTQFNELLANMRTAGLLAT